MRRSSPSREAVPHMREVGGGSIVNVSSAAALMPVPHMSVYGMSKLALEHSRSTAHASCIPTTSRSTASVSTSPVATEGFMANAPDGDHDYVGAVASRCRRHRVDAAPAAALHRLARVDAPARRARRHHAQPGGPPDRKPRRPTELLNGLSTAPAYTRFVNG